MFPKVQENIDCVFCEGNWRGCHEGCTHSSDKCSILWGNGCMVLKRETQGKRLKYWTE